MAKNLHEIIITDDGSQNIIESDFGKEVQRTKDYGCGIDVHSAFIQVSVLVKSELSIFEFRKQFDTTWESITKAKEWIIDIIHQHSKPYVDPTKNFHYCLESTSNYHQVVVKTWEGNPSVINPSLARAGKKKTDYTRSFFIRGVRVREIDNIGLYEKNLSDKKSNRVNI